MVKKGWAGENERAKMLRSSGWFVTRNSGSIGAGDLIAVKVSNKDSVLFKHFVMIEQVKTIALEKFYVYENTRSELRRLQIIWEKYDIPSYLTIRFGGGVWQSVRIDFLDVEKIKSVNVKGEVNYG